MWLWSWCLTLCFAANCHTGRNYSNLHLSSINRKVLSHTIQNCCPIKPDAMVPDLRFPFLYFVCKLHGSSLGLPTSHHPLSVLQCHLPSAGSGRQHRIGIHSDALMQRFFCEFEPYKVTKCFPHRFIRANTIFLVVWSVMGGLGEVKCHRRGSALQRERRRKMRFNERKREIHEMWCPWGSIVCQMSKSQSVFGGQKCHTHSHSIHTPTHQPAFMADAGYI